MRRREEVRLLGIRGGSGDLAPRFEEIDGRTLVDGRRQARLEPASVRGIAIEAQAS
jgi:hypothetical protein